MSHEWSPFKQLYVSLHWRPLPRKCSFTWSIGAGNRNQFHYDTKTSFDKWITVLDQQYKLTKKRLESKVLHNIIRYNRISWVNSDNDVTTFHLVYLHLYHHRYRISNLWIGNEVHYLFTEFTLRYNHGVTTAKLTQLNSQLNRELRTQVSDTSKSAS